MTETTNAETWRHILSEVQAEFDVRKSVIVTGSFRAGTSLVCSMLGANGLEGIRLERFADLWQYREAASEEQIRTALRDIFHATRNGVFVTKIMWPHRNDLAVCMGYERADSAALARCFPDSKWINITRQDKIGQAISFWRAKTTNEWASNARARGEAVREIKLEYDFDAIRACFIELSAHDLLWKDFHTAAETDVMQIVYEDFVQDQAAHLSLLQNFLTDHGVPSGQMSQDTPYRKQRDDLSRDYKQRFLEEMYRTGF